jgi:hypothetical protein
MKSEPASQGSVEELDDLIFANRKIEAIRLLRERRGLSLAAATEAVAVRYGELRRSATDRFICGDAEYWQGFYS